MVRWICLVLVLAVATAATPPPLPDTAASRQFGAWLQAFNSGDRATLARYLQTYYPERLKNIDDVMAFRARTGGFDVRKVEKATTTTFVAIVEDRLNEQFAELTMNVENAAPYRVVNIAGQIIARPAEFAPPPMTQAELIAALRTKVDGEAAADRFSGAVLIAKDGTPVFEQAYGFADRERQIRNTLDTRFRLGSMNKMFTAVATLQLVQAGKIKLDDPFGKYVTDYPSKDVASQVTIHQLLTHTGGTGDIFGPEFEKHRLDLRTLADYEALYGGRALLFPPGSRWQYSNYGFILLGLVIEKVSGQSYYDYVRDHIYVPAGMTSSGSEPEDVAVPGRSIGYMDVPDKHWVPNTDTLPYRGSSAGGGYSTVGDLLKFAQSLVANRLLSAQYTDLLTTGKVDVPGGSRYGYGFDDSRINGVRCFGHNGGAPGMNGNLTICPASGYVVAVLANLDPPSAERISDFITDRLPAP